MIYFQRFGYFLCVVFWDFLFAAAMETDRKIIIAVDDSETSAYAFTWALHHLLKKSDKVIVLTAAPFVTLDFPSTDIASGTYTYIHTCASFFWHTCDFQRFLLLLFNSSSWNRSLYCVVDVVFFFFSFCVCGCLEARFFFPPFLPSVCVEPSSRSSLPKCSIA